MTLTRKITKLFHDEKKVNSDKALKRELEMESEDEEEEDEDTRVERQRNEKMKKMKVREMKDDLKELLKQYQLIKFSGTNKTDYLIGMELKRVNGQTTRKGKSTRNERREHFVSPKNLNVDDIEEQLRFVRSMKKK